jgi:hypothetical protein
MVFAVGGMAAVYFLAPFVGSLLSKLPAKLLVTASIVLVLAFVADVVYSHYVPNIGEGITDYDEYKGSSTLLLADSSSNPDNEIQKIPLSTALKDAEM